MKIITKMTGLRLLEEIVNNNLSCGTMIRYKRDDVALMSNPPQPVYEYYKYTAGDKRFHRCNEKGRLGAKGQQRFMNYGTLKKEFEIVELIEEEIEKPLKIRGYAVYKNKDGMSFRPIIDEEQDIEELEIIEDGGDTGINGEYMNYKQFRVVGYKINELVRAVNEIKKNER